MAVAVAVAAVAGGRRRGLVRVLRRGPGSEVDVEVQTRAGAGVGVRRDVVEIVRRVPGRRRHQQVQPARPGVRHRVHAGRAGRVGRVGRVGRGSGGYSYSRSGPYPCSGTRRPSWVRGRA